MKGNAYSTLQSCAATHSHPQTSQAAIWTLDHLYGSPLCYSKVASKTRAFKYVLNVKIDSSYMYCCVHGEKSNLLSWPIRPVFAEPIKYIYFLIPLPVQTSLLQHTHWISKLIYICLHTLCNHSNLSFHTANIFA